jgi:hypothetical protein
MDPAQSGSDPGLSGPGPLGRTSLSRPRTSRDDRARRFEMHVYGGLTFAIAAAVVFGAPLLWLAWWFIADATRGPSRRRPVRF